MRSPAYELLAVNAETDQTAAAVQRLMVPEQVSRVRSALRSTNIEMTLPGDAEVVILSALIGKFLRITGGGMSPAARDEFTAGALAEFADLPYLLVVPALEDARRKVEFPGKLVVWVFAQIEGKMAALKRERATYQRLLDLAATANG